MEGESHESDLQVPDISADQIDADIFNGPSTPVPPGYTMLGRLHAVGYMRGLMEAVTDDSQNANV